jgi:DUF4097 and DUF4098 domain-containing protein YvlB
MLKSTDMKLIKITAIAIITYLLAIGMARAQEQIAVPLSNPGDPGSLDVEIIRGSINIRSYEGEEVVIRIHGGERRVSREEREDGMRRISGPSIGIEVTEQDNEVRVDASPSSQTSNLEILVPSNFSVDASTINNGNINISGLQGEIEASNVNGSIYLEDISGAVVASTVNGRVEVNFRSVTPDTPMAFSSLNGDIDVTFPADVKMDAQMKTLNGEVYTDFEMDISAGSNVEKQRKNGVYKVTIDKNISGTINGGGPKMIFKNHNGNIYIRKQ